MPRKRSDGSFLRAVLLIAAVAASIGPARGFATYGDVETWPDGDIVLQLQLQSGGPSGADWNQTATDAAAVWNRHMVGTRLTWVKNSGAAKAAQNRFNNVFWSDTVYGEKLDAYTLGITAGWEVDGDQSTIAEADVVFNTKAGPWAVYRGALRSDGTSDFRRVAIHEFGHVLGLDHPDEHGSATSALMNSVITDVDDLTDDDRNAITYLYGPKVPVIVRPPADLTMSNTSAYGLMQATIMGRGPLTVRWRRDGRAMSGFNETSRLYYPTTSVSVSRETLGRYDVVVANRYGVVTSSSAKIVVPHGLSEAMADQAVNPGGTATFKAVVTGTGPATYRWYFAPVNANNDTLIPAATGSTLTIKPVRASDLGRYRVEVKIDGRTTSGYAQLTFRNGVIEGPSQEVAAGQTVTVGVNPQGQSYFENLRDLSIDAAGNLYVADDSLRKVSTKALVTTLAPDTYALLAPHGAEFLALNTAGVAFRVTADGTGLPLINGNGNSPDGWASGTRFGALSGFATGAGGDLFLADSGNAIIRRVSAKTLVTTFAGTENSHVRRDGKGTAAGFETLGRMVAGPGGVLYVVDLSAKYAVIRRIAADGTVTTYAGGAGSPGHQKDGVGTAATFARADALAIDGAGNLYVADAGTVRRISTTRQVTTLAGAATKYGYVEGTGAAARFSEGIMLTVSAGGTVYVADRGNRVIRRVTPAGAVSTFAGAPQESTLRQQDGSQVALQWWFQGKMLAGATQRFLTLKNFQKAQVGNYTVVAKDPTGPVVSAPIYLGLLPAIAKQPAAAGFVQGGTVTLSVSATSPAGRALTYQWMKDDRAIAGATAATLKLTNVDRADLAIYRVIVSDGIGSVYSTSVFLMNAFKLALTTAPASGTYPDGSDVTLAATGENGDEPQFGNLAGLVADGAGNLYVADVGPEHSMIRRLSPTGRVTTLAGGTTFGAHDGQGSAATFGGPTGMTIDAAGNLYVVDGSLVRRVTAAGAVTTIAGQAGSVGSADGQGSAARFWWLSAIAADANGNLYVTDYSNHNVRKITPAGVVSTLAGTAKASGSANGVGAAARFSFPSGVAVDPAGNVYVSDGNYIIRRIDPSGAVTDLAGVRGDAGSNDGTGSGARFGFISALAWGPDGNLYAAEETTSRVRRITPAGVVTTVVAAGRSGVTAPGFGGLAFAPDGTLFLSERTGQAIDRVTAGQLLLYAGGTAIGPEARDGSLLRYQWSFNGAAIAGATSPSLTIPNLQIATAGTYAITVSNAYGSVARDAVVTRAASAPRITSFATGTRTLNPGGDATLTVTARGTEPITYQWLKDGLPLAGATATTLTLAAVQAADAGYYSVVALNAGGSATGGPAAVNVAAGNLPWIGTQPAGVTVGSGYPVMLRVAAGGGTPTLRYQWKKNGQDLPGATGTTLAIAHALAADSGIYTVVVTNDAGQVVSAAATVVVHAAVRPSISPLTAIVAPEGALSGFQPTVHAGDSLTTYQWRKDGVDLPGATQLKLDLSPLAMSAEGTYTLAVHTDAGTVTSTASTVMVIPKVVAATVPDQTMKEGGTLTVPIGLTGFTSRLRSASVSVEADNTSLFPSGSITTGGVANRPTLTLRPAAGRSGSATVKLRITDGVAGAEASFRVTVQHVNHRPVISAIPSQTITSSAWVEVSFTVDDPDPDDDVYVSLKSGDTRLLAASGFLQVWDAGDPPDLQRYRITPVLNRTGTVTVTVSATDRIATTRTQFAITMTDHNQAPTLAAIANQTTKEDTPTAAIALKIADHETPPAWLALTAVSSDPSLVPADHFAFSGSGANRKLVITPAPNASGKAKITVSVSDGAKSANRSFTLTVKAVNDAPTLDPIANQTLAENATSNAIPLHLADVDNAVAGLKLSVTSGDPTLLPATGLTLGGSGANRTLKLRPAAGHSGSTTVKVTVSDGQLSANRTFTLKVTPAPHAPTLAAIADQTWNENQQSATIACTVGDADTPLSSLKLSATSSNPTLLPAGAFVFGGSGANRTLRLTPATDAHGTATVTVTVSDGQLTASRSFAVTVRARPSVAAATATRQVLTVGQPLLLGVTVTATGSAHYQWYRNARTLAATDASQYGLAAVAAADAGVYWVDVTDDVGTRRSAPFFVLVPPEATTVRAWGSTVAGQTAVPAGLGTIAALASGPGHVLAVRVDGTVAAWGANDSGQTTVPAGLTNVVAVAAGSTHSLALRSDGTVVAWGATAAGATQVPTGLANVMAVAAGQDFSLALRTDGTVAKWGTGGDPLPAGLARVIAIAASGRHALALRADGTIAVWGANLAAQLVPPLADRSAVAALAAGTLHSLVLHTDGTVGAWGDDSFGQIDVPAQLTDVTGIAAGGRHSLAMRADGSVVAWGDNAAGQTAVPADLDLATGVAAGDAVSLAVTDTTPYAPLTITTQPADFTVTTGGEAVLNIGVTGYPAPHYRWQRSDDGGQTWADLADDATFAGTGTSLLTIASVPIEFDGLRFRCVVSNAVQPEVASTAATLTVQPAE